MVDFVNVLATWTWACPVFLLHSTTGEGVLRLQNVVRAAQLIIMKNEEMLTDWLRIVIEGALRNGFSQWLRAARVGIWLRRLCSIQQGAGKTNLLCRSCQRVAKSATTKQWFVNKEHAVKHCYFWYSFLQIDAHQLSSKAVCMSSFQLILSIHTVDINKKWRHAAPITLFWQYNVQMYLTLHEVEYPNKTDINFWNFHLKLLLFKLKQIRKPASVSPLSVGFDSNTLPFYTV